MSPNNLRNYELVLVRDKFLTFFLVLFSILLFLPWSLLPPWRNFSTLHSLDLDLPDLFNVLYLWDSSCVHFFHYSRIFICVLPTRLTCLLCFLWLPCELSGTFIYQRWNFYIQFVWDTNLIKWSLPILAFNWDWKVWKVFF